MKTPQKAIFTVGGLVGAVGSNISGHGTPLQFVEFDPAVLGNSDPRPIPITLSPLPVGRMRVLTTYERACERMRHTKVPTKPHTPTSSASSSTLFCVAAEPFRASPRLNLCVRAYVHFHMHVVFSRLLHARARMRALYQQADVIPTRYYLVSN